MRLLDQTRAIFRLVIRNNEEGTISEEAKKAAAAALIEREKTNRAMDDLLASLIRQNLQRAEGTNGTYP